MKTGFLTLAFVAFLGLMVWTVNVGMGRQEVVDCNTLVAQAQEYKGQFYITSWQKAMCDEHGISVNAPVR